MLPKPLASLSSSPAALICAFAAVALPLLVAATSVPDAVFYNQLLALAGWGLWLCWRGAMAGQRDRRSASMSVALPAALAFGLCAVFAAARSDVGQASAALTLAAAIAVLAAAASISARQCSAAIAWAWCVAGLLCVGIAALQYFAPSTAEGWFIAANSAPGRAVGNMRQPNHLATALLCAMVMTAWLWQAGRLHAAAGAASIAAMVFALGLSASRTGALSLGVLLLWAVLDRSLPRALRWTLALTPLLYLLCWAGLAQYAEWQHANFYGADRLQSGADISSSRFAIWKNALALIAQQPWVGVGWGNFNFAWTFTPFPDRPVAFFDHTHNLPLQLAVEIGVPATAAVLGLLGWALWRARGAWRVAGAQPGHPARAALVMLAVLAMHSLLEYPLWYAYFLLPAAWALGMFLGSAADAERGDAGASRMASQVQAWTLRLAGAAMLLGAAYAAWDHRRIEVIFAPPSGAAPLEARIAEGRKSPLFGHHADYAAVTTEPEDETLASFRRPLHQLVDVRLLIAYIEALRVNGRDAEALYAAQRLREFRRDDAQAYFKDCTPYDASAPFQCNTTPVPLSWRDLEP